MEKIQNLLGSSGWDFFVSTQGNLILKNMLLASEEKICLQLLRSNGPQNTLLLKVKSKRRTIEFELDGHCSSSFQSSSRAALSHGDGQRGLPVTARVRGDVCFPHED